MPGPAGTHQRHVTLGQPHTRTPQASFEVVGGHAVPAGKHVDFLGRGDVQQHPPPDERRNRLGAVYAEPATRLRLGGVVATVQQPVLGDV